MLYAALSLVGHLAGPIMAATVEFSDGFRLDPSLDMLMQNLAYLAGRRTRALPGWLVWPAAVITVLALVAELTFGLAELLFLAWVLAGSFALMRRA